jgi:hypothetical protein
MSWPKDEQPDTDEGDEDGEFERLRDMLHAHISEFAEEHDLPDGELSPLLLDLAVTSRMTDYVMSVAKPSGSGLKLDLDRLGREIEDFVRDCKRHSDEFVAHSKDVLAEAAKDEMEAEAELKALDQVTPRKP